MGHLRELPQASLSTMTADPGIDLSISLQTRKRDLNLIRQTNGSLLRLLQAGSHAVPRLVSVRSNHARQGWQWRELREQYS
jgi:hypothetical protein